MTDQTNVAPQPSVPETPPTPSFTVPEAYAAKGWAKDIKSPDDLWKLTDNAQSLIGKRPAGIPAADAPQEEWDKFYTAAGRPAKPEEYVFSDVEGTPEGFDTAPYKQIAAKMFHDAGLAQQQSDKIWQMYLNAELGKSKENTEAWQKQQSALDAEFDSHVKKVFGEKSDDAITAALDASSKYVPPELSVGLQELKDNPKALVVYTVTINKLIEENNKIRAEYGAEGKVTSGQQTASLGINETRDMLATLRISQAAKDFTHRDHAKTIQKINELSGQVGRFYNK